MNMKRLSIMGFGRESIAMEEGKPYKIVNPSDIPESALDGIFTIDYKNETARFESRTARSRLMTVSRRPTEDIPWTPRPVTLPDGTRSWTLLEGAVVITVKGDTAIVDAEMFPEDVQKLIGALALEGVVAWQEIAKALRYILEKE